MARSLRFLVLILSVASICNAATFNPISDAHRSAALDLFTPSIESFKSLEETYEVLRTFEVLGIDKVSEVKKSSCSAVVETLWSSTSASKDVFLALRVNGILKCELNDEAFGGIASRLKDSIHEANALLDYYYTIGSLKLIMDQAPDLDVHLEDADVSFRAIKALSQSDGRWRYGSNNPESSNYAAGIALETLAGVVSLASQEIDETLFATLKKDIQKLFDGIQKYDDGSCYFDEKLVDAKESQGPLSASSSIVRGLTAFAASTSETLNLGDKLLCLARFFLGVGVPSNPKDLYHQIDALGQLESNRVSVPLILSVPATVLSATRKDKLKVRVSTVLGSAAPPLSVKLMQIFASGSKDASVVDQELKLDVESGAYILDDLHKDVDIGVYTFSFEIVLQDPENKKIYATGGRTKVIVYVTGVVNIDHAEVAILDNDNGVSETKNKLSLVEEKSLSLSANHLQKLRLAFQLATPAGHAFKPHQAFLQLKHESGVNHIFLVGSSDKKFDLTLDFLGLVEKFFYLSGRYDIKLTVGDSVMENSFFTHLGHLDLDLPEAPEKAVRPPPQAVDPISRYGPKAEITHIFRSPEKRPPRELSLIFLGLVLVPLVGFLVGLLLLRVNLSNFPKSSGPVAFAVLFHLGLAAVLVLYLLFWLKFDLFTTLKALGFLGIFLMFVGHKTLSHLASSTSSKLKSA